MKFILQFIYVFISIILLTYLALPSPDFPKPPDLAIQSQEPADTETDLRRAYFANLSREEVVSYYQSEFVISVLGYKIPSYRLNYPPEEAYSLIRDQTRSTYLEEIVYPLRESVFVNGYIPTANNDPISLNGVPYKQKTTIRYVPNNTAVRLFLGTTILVVGYIVITLVLQELHAIYRSTKSALK